MATTEVQGRYLAHQVKEETGHCSCGFTHGHVPQGGWDITSDVKWGELTEIPPIYDGAVADIYVNWPFC